MEVKLLKGVICITSVGLEDFNLNQIKGLLISKNIKYNKNKYFKCLFNNNVATIMLSNDLRVNNILIVENLIYILKDLLMIYKEKICFKSQLEKVYSNSIEAE